MLTCVEKSQEEIKNYRDISLHQMNEPFLILMEMVFIGSEGLMWSTEKTEVQAQLEHCKGLIDLIGETTNQSVYFSLDLLGFS